MQEFERATFHKESLNEENTSGSYVFEPLERGFGTTVGNTICSTMLSDLPGTKVIAFRVDGSNVDDLTVDGVREDVITIGLNLKAVKLLNEVEGPVCLHISKQGPALVTSADMICPEGVTLVDPDQVVCNLEKSASLEMDIIIAKGYGYKSAEDNKADYELADDMHVLDAIFTPIRKAEYKSEPARIGFDKKYDKVHFDVTTDGTITPLDAISTSASKVIDILDAIIPVADLDLEESFAVQEVHEEETQKVNTMMIEDLDLSVRSYNCLKRAGIQTVDELTQKTEDEMMHVKNLGKKSLKEVKDKMYQLNLFFKSYE